MNKTLKELAKEAIDVQDACNLSGVAHGFSKMISNLRILGITDTDKINNHPIVRVWVSKIASLSGMNDDRNFGDAYRWCLSLGDGREGY